MKKLALILVVCGLIFASCKEKKDNSTFTGVISAYLEYQDETVPAEEATVYLHNEKAEAYIQSTVAKSDGSYSFTAVPDGEYQISAKWKDTKYSARPSDYYARTASYTVAGEQEEKVDITVKEK